MSCYTMEACTSTATTGAELADKQVLVNCSTLLGAIISWGFLWPYISIEAGEGCPSDLRNDFKGLYGYKSIYKSQLQHYSQPVMFCESEYYENYYLKDKEEVPKADGSNKSGSKRNFAAFHCAPLVVSRTVAIVRSEK
ncbi:hypothetical protein EJB05_29598 [Eragrostis curvula]|uniref:Uncharacterized protein n=1 Tax=Eragrostis curvula TaxID=38414 RepID=A0A5J9UVH3_9POAL|nr:hypothetical protein EJB05_29598 [Eragrostis curvula]